MAVYIGSKKVKELYYGGKKVKEVWYGGKKVYTSALPFWREGVYYNKGDGIIIDIYGELYRYYATSPHLSDQFNKPFYGSVERNFWGRGVKVS